MFVFVVHRRLSNRSDLLHFCRNAVRKLRSLWKYIEDLCKYAEDFLKKISRQNYGDVFKLCISTDDIMCELYIYLCLWRCAYVFYNSRDACIVCVSCWWFEGSIFWDVSCKLMGELYWWNLFVLDILSLICCSIVL